MLLSESTFKSRLTIENYGFVSSIWILLNFHFGEKYFGQECVFYFSVRTQTWRTFLFEKRTFFRKCLFNITIESSLESNNFPLVEMMGLTWKCSLTPQHTLSNDWEFEFFKAWEIETQKENFNTLCITSFSTDSIVCE